MQARIAQIETLKLRASSSKGSDYSSSGGTCSSSGSSRSGHDGAHAQGGGAIPGGGVSPGSGAFFARITGECASTVDVGRINSAVCEHLGALEPRLNGARRIRICDSSDTWNRGEAPSLSVKIVQLAVSLPSCCWLEQNPLAAGRCYSAVSLSLSGSPGGSIGSQASHASSRGKGSLMASAAAAAAGNPLPPLSPCSSHGLPPPYPSSATTASGVGTAMPGGGTAGSAAEAGAEPRRKRGMGAAAAAAVAAVAEAEKDDGVTLEELTRKFENQARSPPGRAGPTLIGPPAEVAVQDPPSAPALASYLLPCPICSIKNALLTASRLSVCSIGIVRLSRSLNKARVS